MADKSIIVEAFNTKGHDNKDFVCNSNRHLNCQNSHNLLSQC